MKTHIAFARIVPKREYFDKAKEAILSIIPKTLNETGCNVFTLHEPEDKDDPALYLYEVWENEKAFNFHHEQEYTKEVFRLYENWLAEPVEIKKLERIL